MRVCVMAAVVTLAWGCAPTEAPRTEKKGKAKVEHLHEPGPHGGVIVDWGRKYHAEVCIDRRKKEATVYVLGGDEVTPSPIKADGLTLTVGKAGGFQVELKKSPQKGDPEGACSRFVGADERLGRKDRFEGVISGVLEGKPYAADFAEEGKQGE